jgi:nucleoside-diphosphate-sugar epimerase
MRRVLLTGATGFIGQHCVAPLLARGYEVHAITARSPAPDDGPVVWHQANLLDPQSVTELIATVRPSDLLHMAWYVAHGKYWSAPENLSWVRASLQLLESFREHGGERAVFAGTCAEYDWSYGYCVEQVTPAQPASLYGTCKNALRSIVAAYAAQHSLSVAWGRIFFLYGPHEPPARFVASIVRSLLAHEPARCSHGRQVRDLLYVQDVADAFVALLASPAQGAVNIGSGRPTTLGEVATMIGQTLGRPDLIQLGAIAAPAGDPPLLLADVRRIQHEVGWQATVTLEQGLDHTINWWRAQP